MIRRRSLLERGRLRSLACAAHEPTYTPPARARRTDRKVEDLGAQDVLPRALGELGGRGRRRRVEHGAHRRLRAEPSAARGDCACSFWSAFCLASIGSSVWLRKRGDASSSRHTARSTEREGGVGKGRRLFLLPSILWTYVV
jgi:hypothetical protein